MKTSSKKTISKPFFFNTLAVNLFNNISECISKLHKTLRFSLLIICKMLILLSVLNKHKLCIFKGILLFIIILGIAQFGDFTLKGKSHQ